MSGTENEKAVKEYLARSPCNWQDGRYQRILAPKILGSILEHRRLLEATLKSAKRTIPGPKRDFLTGSLPAIRRDRVQFLVDLQRDYGDVVMIRLGPIKALTIFHPDAIQRVMQDNQSNYSKNTLAFNSMRLVFWKWTDHQ